MADEDYRWLDREAAERLLRGEPLEAVDADTKERVERLAEVLASLVAEPAPDGAELPGEAAALAAFRATRAGRDGVSAQAVAGRDPRAAAHSADAGLVRLGSPGPGGHRARWGRPVRFGLAAALAVGMIGGVAVAAGTGVLPTPFRDDRSHPAATVSAAQTPQRPLVSPSPGVSQADGSEVPLPGATTSGSAGSGSSDDVAAGDSASGQPHPSGPGRPARSHEWWSRTRSSCRDVLGGKNLEAGRRRVLTDAAGGGGRVKSFCRRVLGWTGAGSGEGRDDRGGQDGQGDGQSGSGPGHESGHGSGDGKGGDDGGHMGPGGNGHHHSGVFTPVLPSALAPVPPRTSALSSAVRDTVRADEALPQRSAV
ncbi:hypothetical protein ACIOTI_26235 [Streptomyces sp. NPDC087843]|uniref:hypothetical protein n=1 Tax=Streptomyces sp. NPDC087843 TaxID=3365804 RepID=UPI003823BCCA